MYRRERPYGVADPRAIQTRISDGCHCNVHGILGVGSGVICATSQARSKLRLEIGESIAQRRIEHALDGCIGGSASDPWVAQYCAFEPGVTANLDDFRTLPCRCDDDYRVRRGLNDSPGSRHCCNRTIRRRGSIAGRPARIVWIRP